MPEVKSGESRQDYVGRCVPYVIKKEGATQKQALGKCFGMYDYYTKNEDIVHRLSKFLIGDEATVAGDIATNDAGCFKKKKKKKTNEDRVVHRSDPRSNRSAWFVEDNYGSVIGGPFKNEREAKKFMKEINDSTVIGGAYVGSAGNIAGSGQTRTVGDRRGEIEVLTRKPRPLKWSDFLGLYVPDEDITENLDEGSHSLHAVIKTSSDRLFMKKYIQMVDAERQMYGDDPYSGSWATVPTVQIVPMPMEFQGKKMTKNMMNKVYNYLLDKAEKWEPAKAMKTSKGYIVAAWAIS